MPKDIKLGLLAYSSRTGLGVQTRNYYKFLKPLKTMVVDLSELNYTEQNPEWYPDGIFVKGIPTKSDIDLFLQGLEVVLVAETPLNYYLFEKAREMNIRTILVPNWEFLDYLQRPSLPKPDLILAPSIWHEEDLQVMCYELGIEYRYLPVPIDRSVLPFESRTKLKSFLHIAGRKTYQDRNGTDIFLASIPYVKSDVKFYVRRQQNLMIPDDDRLILIDNEAKEYQDMYKKGDVLVMPRKYGGLCLPLNEAMSRGMIPLMTECEPQEFFLAEESLVAPFTVSKIMTRTEIECFLTTPQRLAEAIDRLANMPEYKVEELNTFYNRIAQMWSWDVMLEQYEETIEHLCRKRVF